MATLFRVVNQQLIRRSILLDKIDRSQGNFTGYAHRAKQKLYVPYSNPLDATVKGYVDLAPTDEVLLQVNQPKGVIAQLSNKGYVTFVAFSSALTIAPTVTASVHGVPTGQTGTNGSWAAAVGGFADFTDAVAGAFVGGDVGKFITVSGSAFPLTNNGTFLITVNVGANTDTTKNAVAVVDAGPLTWSISSGTTITGTTFLSLAPDQTYVILTNNISGATQTISQAAILAAGGTVSGTSIVFPNTLVSIGTPAAGWKVKVQANSKISNTFTMT